MRDRPLLRLDVPLDADGSIHVALVDGYRLAREHYGEDTPFRRLGYKVSDAVLTAWYGEEVTG